MEAYRYPPYRCLLYTSPAELFAVLYEAQNNAPMSKEQENMIAQLIEEIWEDMR